MKAKNLGFACLALTLSLTAAVARAQSLGEVARRQRAKQGKEATKPAKLYTNENLPARPSEGGQTAASAMSTAPAEQSSTAQPESSNAPPEEKVSESATETKPAQAEKEKPEDKRRTRDYWQARFKSVRQELARAQEEQQLAEDELNLLRIQQARELDMTVQRDIEGKITAKTADLASKRAATEKVQKTLNALEKEFKESGAPEEWSKTE